MVSGFAFFYGHRMCAIRYGITADTIYNQNRLLFSSFNILKY
jgi:hypothetical protein